MIRPRFLLLAVTILASTCLAAEDPLWVAVGYGGRRASSRDGITWENDQRWSDEARDDDNVLFNVAYGLNRFIAVGGGARIGHMLSTIDGVKWQALPPRQGRVATIAFGRDRFVAGHDAELLWSTDGATFHPGEKLPFKGSVHARRSASGDTEAGYRFVITGDVDLASEKRRAGWRGVTGDGTRWEHAAADTAPASDVAHGAGRFVCVGPAGLVESSHDGQTWQRHRLGVGDDFNRVVWTGSRFLVAGGKLLWTSPDGLTWTAASHGLPCAPAWARDDPAFHGIGLSWGGSVWSASALPVWKRTVIVPGPSFEAVGFRGNR